MKAHVSIVFFVLMVGSLATFGQGGQQKKRSFNAEELAKKNSNEMKDRLKLTDNQFKKVETINLKAAKEMENIYDNSMGDRNAARMAMMKVNDETNKELKLVLTEDQWKEYEILQKERRERALRNPVNTP